MLLKMTKREREKMNDNGVLAEIFSWTLVLGAPGDLLSIALVCRQWARVVKGFPDQIWKRKAICVLQSKGADAVLTEHFFDYDLPQATTRDRYRWILRPSVCLETYLNDWVRTMYGSIFKWVDKHCCTLHGEDAVRIMFGMQYDNSMQGHVTTYCNGCKSIQKGYMLYDRVEDENVFFPYWKKTENREGDVLIDLKVTGKSFTIKNRYIREVTVTNTDGTKQKQRRVIQKILKDGKGDH